MFDGGVAASRALTSTETRLARQWIHAAKFRSYSHHACARGFRLMHLASLAIVVTIASLCSCYNAYASIREHSHQDIDIEQDARWSVIVAVLNGLIVVVSTIHHYCEVPGVMHRHAQTSNDYAGLARDVQVELVLTKSMRTGMYSSPAEFLRDIKRRLEDIADEEPPIPKFVSRYVTRRLRNNRRAIRASVFAFADDYEAGQVPGSEISSDTFPEIRRSEESPARPKIGSARSMDLPRTSEPSLTFV